MNDLSLKEYISAEQIQEKVKELGAQLTKKYHGEPVVAICVLKGSFMFFSDLVRNIQTDLSCDFFAISSYNGKSISSGEVRMTMDLGGTVEGKHVLLIEDILDTGITMNYLIQNIKARSPKSLSTVALLEKKGAAKVDVKVDHIGFQIANEFVVGYGLDYQGYYRNLPYIAQVQNFQ